MTLRNGDEHSISVSGECTCEDMMCFIAVRVLGSGSAASALWSGFGEQLTMGLQMKFKVAHFVECFIAQATRVRAFTCVNKRVVS